MSSEYEIAKSVVEQVLNMPQAEAADDYIWRQDVPQFAYLQDCARTAICPHEGRAVGRSPLSNRALKEPMFWKRLQACVLGRTL